MNKAESKESKEMLGKGLNVVGIVGENGKSIVAQMISHCYQELEIEGNYQSATDFFDKKYDERYEKNAKDVIIEVSVCAIKEKKSGYIDFDNLIFTNSSSHTSLDDKWTMMRPFIALPQNKTAIINIDDESGTKFCDVTIAKTLTYACNKTADINAKNIEQSIDKTAFDLYYKGSFACRMVIPYFGIYNVYNALAAVAHFVIEGYEPKRVAQLLRNLPQIKGRFDMVLTNSDIKVIVDYAKTPEAINAVLTSLAVVCQGKIITVVGASGGADADVNVRMSIGKNTLAHSHQVIFTTNNPHEQDPQSIIYDMLKGNIRTNYRICLDREKAIEIALKMAKPKDIVILLGKGHEKAQIMGNKTTFFCDETTATYLVKKLEI